MRTTRHLGLAVVLCALGVVFCMASAVAAKVFCKTWTGYVKVREESCKSWETEIQLPEGPQGDTGATGPTGPTGQSAADLCEPGQLLMSADNPDGYVCHTPAEILAMALCGNGVVDAGEQCDDGPDNGPSGVCTAQCRWNCPCDFFDLIPFQDWTDFDPRWQTGQDPQRSHCTLSNPTQFFPAGQVFDDEGQLGCSVFTLNDGGFGVNISARGGEACDRALVDYVTQLNGSEFGPVDGSPLTCGLFTP